MRGNFNWFLHHFIFDLDSIWESHLFPLLAPPTLALLNTVTTKLPPLVLPVSLSSPNNKKEKERHALSPLSTHYTPLCSSVVPLSASLQTASLSPLGSVLVVRVPSSLPLEGAYRGGFLRMRLVAGGGPVLGWHKCSLFEVLYLFPICKTSQTWHTAISKIMWVTLENFNDL